MEFSEQAMIKAWIGVSLDRLAHVRGRKRAGGQAPSSVRIDAVRADAHAPVVTVVNWHSVHSHSVDPHPAGWRPASRRLAGEAATI